MAHLKGKDVNIGIYKDVVGGQKRYQCIAGSQSCDVNIQANTVNGSAKDDIGDGMFQRNMFLNYTWSINNESFLVDTEYLVTLLDKVINGDDLFDVVYYVDRGEATLQMTGLAIITSLTVDATDGDMVKLSISMTGTGEFSRNYRAIMQGLQNYNMSYLRGKSLMISVKDTDFLNTIACSKSHKLTVNVQTENISDKDGDSSAVNNEITSKSVSLYTSNLIYVGNNRAGYDIGNIITNIIHGNELELHFGWYGSEGSIHDDPDAEHGWGEEDAKIITGTFICTSLSTNGTNGQRSTYEAEFVNSGAIYVGTQNESSASE